MVSVIIPYFNKEATIDRAVESVIAQSYCDWEIIIVDDCSNVLLTIRDNWKNHTIHILRNETNKGPGPSRQRGMEHARGDYLAFLDADDWWDREFLSKSVSHLSDSDNNNFGSCWSKTQVIKKYTVELKKYNNLDHTNIINTLLKFGHPWATSSILWKKQSVGDWGSLSTNQDSWFEYKSSLINNNTTKINDILVFKDETCNNHRVDLVKMSEINVNRFILYHHIISKKWHNFNFYEKIIGINRMLWVIEKNKSNSQISNLSKQETPLLLRIIIICFSDAHIMRKILHRILQTTKYKIYQ